MTEEPRLVLVVEDEPQMLRFLRASLTSHGFRTLEAMTAAEAIALGTTHAPELVLLDLGLPDLDGIEVTRRFREWTRVPIIVISARGREDDKVEALDAGADDFVLEGGGRVLHVVNAPSPAATSSLAIGAEIARRALDALP